LVNKIANTDTIDTLFTMNTHCFSNAFLLVWNSFIIFIWTQESCLLLLYTIFALLSWHLLFVEPEGEKENQSGRNQLHSLFCITLFFPVILMYSANCYDINEYTIFEFNTDDCCPSVIRCCHTTVLPRTTRLQRHKKICLCNDIENS